MASYTLKTQSQIKASYFNSMIDRFKLTNREKPAIKEVDCISQHSESPSKVVDQSPDLDDLSLTIPLIN